MDSFSNPKILAAHRYIFSVNALAVGTISENPSAEREVTQVKGMDKYLLTIPESCFGLQGMVCGYAP